MFDISWQVDYSIRLPPEGSFEIFCLTFIESQPVSELSEKYSPALLWYCYSQLTFFGFLIRYFLLRVLQDVFLATLVFVPGPQTGPEARLPLLLFSLLAWILLCLGLLLGFLLFVLHCRRRGLSLSDKESVSSVHRVQRKVLDRSRSRGVTNLSLDTRWDTQCS